MTMFKYEVDLTAKDKFKSMKEVLDILHVHGYIDYVRMKNPIIYKTQIPLDEETLKELNSIEGVHFLPHI